MFTRNAFSLAVLATVVAGCVGTQASPASISSVENAFSAEGVPLGPTRRPPKASSSPLSSCPKVANCARATITVTLHEVPAPHPLVVLYPTQQVHGALVVVSVYRTAADARAAQTIFQSRRLTAGRYLIHDNVMVGYILSSLSAAPWFQRIRRALRRA